MKGKRLLSWLFALSLAAGTTGICAAANELSESETVSIQTYESSDEEWALSFDYCSFYADDGEHIYTGSPVKPSITAYNYYTGDDLKEGVDYTVTADSDPNAGEKTAVIKGLGVYAGQQTEVGYYIYQADLSDGSVSVPSLTYTGTAVKPAAVVKLGGKTLVEGVDYDAEFSSIEWDEYDVGIYYAYFYGKGNYSGYLSGSYRINQKNASSAVVTGIKSKAYDGWEYCPEPTVTLDGKKLEIYDDYTISYKNNNSIGTGTGTITFKGNYSGRKTFTFMQTIGRPAGVSALQGEKTIKVSWNSVPGAAGYQLYRYDAAKKQYVLVGSTKNTAYANSGLQYATAYKYKVRAYYTQNGSTKYGSYSNIINTTTLPPHTTVTMATGEKTCLVKWSKVTGIDGYELMRFDRDSGTYKRYKLMGKNDTQLYITGLSNDTDYRYLVRTYKTVNGKTVYSRESNNMGTQDKTSRFNGLLRSSVSRTYKIYNVTGAKTTTSYRTIPDSEWNLVKKFASTHFKSGWSNYQKAKYTYDYIVNHTNYQNDYSKIDWSRPVYQVFVKREAQCDGFNGAFVAVMRYLGYDMNLIQGTVNQSGGKIGPHWWATIKRGTQNYIFDTNMEYYWSGDTHYFFCAKYSDPLYVSGRYRINNKNRYK